MAVVPPGLTPGTGKERFDFELLYEKSVTNPSGTIESLGAVELDADERAEIVLAEVSWPRAQPSGYIVPKIDGDVYAGGNQVVLRAGYYDTVCPPTDNLLFGGINEPYRVRELFVFGTPGSTDATKNTTLKVKAKMDAKLVTDGAVTGTVTVRYWGYRYKSEAALMRAYPGPVVFGGSFYDANTGRRITIAGAKSIPVNFDNWERLPGGQKQEKPIILPLIRYAINAKATTPNTAYDLRFETGNVAAEHMNMYFDLTPERQRGLIKITHFGIRAAANLKGWGINVNGELRPDKDWVPARTDYNPFHYGHVSPLLPEQVLIPPAGTPGTADINLWMPLRKLVEPIYIYREIGKVQIIDNGTAVSAGAVTVALKAVQIIE